MTWNWQKKHWPSFKYDLKQLEDYEAAFMYKSGIFLGTLKHIQEGDKESFRIEVICEEAYKTSEIEGELLNRESLQSSIRKNFGLKTDYRKIPAAESGIAEMMVDLYKNFSKPLSHKLLYEWNSLIIRGRSDLCYIGKYRQDEDPMQVVSGPLHNPKIHFQAPPANVLKVEMDSFIKWFNASDDAPLIKAGIAHLYFVCIHPFEDGNGRIARALAEKVLSQSLSRASLIPISSIIEKHRKKYYAALDAANKDLEITEWLKYFAQTILEAQDYSQNLIEFLVKKGQFYKTHQDQLNERQVKVIDRIFAEGVNGFKGGLSAEIYIAITKTSRATATRDLQDLVEKNILRRTGQLKSTRYWLLY